MSDGELKVLKKFNNRTQRVLQEIHQIKLERLNIDMAENHEDVHRIYTDLNQLL
jgi:hypothetical protein